MYLIGFLLEVRITSSWQLLSKENESNELGIQIGSVGKGEGKLLLDGVEIKKTGYQHF